MTFDIIHCSYCGHDFSASFATRLLLMQNIGCIQSPCPLDAGLEVNLIRMFPMSASPVVGKKEVSGNGSRNHWVTKGLRMDADASVAAIKRRQENLQEGISGSLVGYHL